MKLRSQKGFTLIEGLLSLIAVALIVFVGYYVYNNQHKANKTLNQVSEASQKSEPAKASFFELPDLGIKIEKTAEIDDFSFKTDPTVPQTRYVHSTRFDEALKKCYGTVSEDGNASTGAFYGISRVEGQYTQGMTDSSGFLVEPPIKQFNTFFVNGSPPNGLSSCTDVSYQSQFEDIHKTLTDQLINAVQSSKQL